MARRNATKRLIDATKQDHVCVACGKVIRKGSPALVTIARKYFHLTLRDRCQEEGS